MFVLDKILAIPDESVDYLQMGISGGERAALAARGFVRKDGIKAKDYMIRTIQKTEKNKAKAEKAIIKGDKKLAEAPDKKELEQRLRKINEEIQTPYLVGAKFKPLVVSNPDRFESLSKEAKEINKSLGNKKREFYESTQDQASTLLRMPAARHKKYVEDALKSGKTVPDEVLKDYPDLSKKYSQSPSNRGLAITDKKGFQSEGGAAKKIKGAIAGVKGGKVVKGVSPRDRASFISKSLQNTLGENNFLVKNKHEGVKLIEDAIKNNRGNLEADSMGKLQVLKINKPSKKFPYGSASIVVDNSTLGKGYGRERSTVDLVYLADNARKLAKKQDSASPMERLDRLVKLGDELKPKQPSAAKKLAITYNKQGDLSEGSAAKKIKAAIARSKADKPEKMTAWQKEYSDKYKAIKSDQKPTQAIVRTYSVSNGDGKGSAVEITFDKDFASDKKLKPILTAYAKDSLLGQVVEHPAPNVLRIRNPDTEVLNKDGKHQYVAKSLAKLGMSVKSDQLIGDKASPVVSTASATPKSRKVVKGMMPVSGRVIEFGKVGKDGFAKVTVTYPVHSTKNKSRSMQSDPQKGEKIGDYFVSGDARSGYGVTHLPSGFQVFSPRSLRDQTGNDNKESAKSTARKLHDAKISLPNTFHKMKNTEPSKYQEFGRKVLNAVNGEGASQQQPERSPNADVKSDRAKPEFTTLAKANQKNVPSAAEQRYASKASKRESSKGKAPLNLKDSLNQQVIRSTERSNRVKLQGKKVSPQRSLEATKFQVANQALTNISANTKRLRRISTGTAKKRTITDSLGNSFTRKKYRFKK